MPRKPFYDNQGPGMERAILIGLVTPNQKEEQLKEYLDELAFLAENYPNILSKVVES